MVVSDFYNDINEEDKGIPYANWFYINVLHATNIRRINYETDPDHQRDGWDVVITLPGYGEMVIQEKFHLNGTYKNMMVEIADVNGTKEGWANKLHGVDVVIDFSRDLIHILNAKKLKLVAQQTRRQWISDGGINHNRKYLSCGSHEFNKYTSWSTRDGFKYWGLCAMIPWDLMEKLHVPMKTYEISVDSVNI